MKISNINILILNIHNKMKLIAPYFTANKKYDLKKSFLYYLEKLDHRRK